MPTNNIIKINSILSIIRALSCLQGYALEQTATKFYFQQLIMLEKRLCEHVWKYFYNWTIAFSLITWTTHSMSTKTK